MSNADRSGDWMQTYTGRQFWPLDPRPEEVSIIDIAHALSLQCRFAGHCRSFYSVAEHSVRVSRIASGPFRLAALLHDAAEAYVVDVPRPLKRSLTGYSAIETRVARAIERRFDLALCATEHGTIKHLDEVMLATEARDIMGGESASKWSLHAAPLPGERIDPWTPAEAERAFLEAFTALQGGQP